MDLSCRIFIRIDRDNFGARAFAKKYPKNRIHIIDLHAYSYPDRIWPIWIELRSRCVAMEYIDDRLFNYLDER